jgi:hypothetical protein
VRRRGRPGLGEGRRRMDSTWDAARPRGPVIVSIPRPSRRSTVCWVRAPARCVYVGDSKNVPERVMWHWGKRNHKQRITENPGFCAWLQGFLMAPDYRILAAVSYSVRFSAERDWTIRLSKTCDLFNISYGAVPLRRLSAGPRGQRRRQRRMGVVRSVEMAWRWRVDRLGGGVRCDCRITEV